MARDDAPPFGRGEFEPTAGALDHLIGKEYVFEDIDYSTTSPGAKPARSGKSVRVRLVRNDNAGSLLPKRLAAFSTTAALYGAVIDGYARTTAARGYPIDEFLPATGVPTGGYCFIVVRGPAIMKLPLAGADFPGNDVSVGDRLVALTAVTSGATTAGRLQKETLTGSSQATDYTFLASQVVNFVGWALSAATSGNTDADLLVEVRSF